MTPAEQSMPHPRALGYTSRSMEILRTLGIEHKLPEIPANFKLRRARVESLAGTWHDETAWTEKQDKEEKKPSQSFLDFSTSLGSATPQDKFEDILREAALKRGVDLRYGNALLDFKQDHDGVTATVKNKDCQEYTLRAAYLIAADGHRSPVREKLGIKPDAKHPQCAVPRAPRRVPETRHYAVQH